MMIIHAFARETRSGERNPKNYPYWEALIEEIQNNKEFNRLLPIVQIGQKGEPALVKDFITDLPMSDIKDLTRKCLTWIGIDSFFQHLAWTIGKPGIVLFGQSNPEIFGHSENINLYADKRFFRPDQFGTWDECKYNERAFVTPDVVTDSLRFILRQGENI